MFGENFNIGFFDEFADENITKNDFIRNIVNSYGNQLVINDKILDLTNENLRSAIENIYIKCFETVKGLRYMLILRNLVRMLEIDNELLIPYYISIKIGYNMEITEDSYAKVLEEFSENVENFSRTRDCEKWLAFLKKTPEKMAGLTFLSKDDKFMKELLKVIFINNYLIIYKDHPIKRAVFSQEQQYAYDINENEFMRSINIIQKYLPNGVSITISHK